MILDLTALVYLCFFSWYKSTWRKITNNSRRRMKMLFIITVICFADSMITCIKRTVPYTTNFCRPVVVLIYLSQQRAQFKNIFVYVLKDTLLILFIIFFYIMFFSVMSFFFYKYSMEGFVWFVTPSESFYQMLILMTTANFPDIMLPAYNASRWNSLYYIGYLTLGLYFL